MKMRVILSATALGLGLTVVLLALLINHSPIARADSGTYYVQEGASGDCLAATTPCSSVQRAINLAVDPDDEVLVAAGVYTENLAITHSVRLRGGWNMSFTARLPATYPTVVIDGSGEHNMRVEGAPQAEVVIEGLALRNGRDGVHVWDGNVTVEQCVILDASKQGFEIDGGNVLISATQIMTAQQGIEVDDGVVRVSNVHIAHIREEGLLIEGGGVVTFTASIIEDCDQQGVQVDAGELWLFDNLIRDINADGVRVEGGVVSIVSNTIHATQSDGLDVSGTQTIKDNLVYDTVKRGIYAHDGALTLLGNTTRDTGGDGIRTDDGTTVTVRGNTVYSSGNDGIDARGTTVVVAGNVVTGCADNGAKIEKAAHAFMDANQVYGAGNAGINLDEAGAFTVTNNIVADANGVSVLVENSAGPHNFVYHNTLVGGATGQQGAGISVTVPGITITLANNIIVSHNVGITATAGASLIVSRTLLWGNGSDPISGTGVITQSPLFVAPASQDCHIQENSPAVDAGIELGVSGDVDGDPRLSFPDVGADEIVEHVYLPLVMRAQVSLGYLQNPGFEGLVCAPDSPGGWCDGNWSNDANHDGNVYDNIFTPQGWVTWWREGESYFRPEVKVIPNRPPYNGSPNRIRSGNYAALLFTFYHRQDMGFYQVVTGLPPGSEVQFSAYAHGWSCDSDDHLGYSCGDPSNQTFQVGIEPHGIADPFSPNITWSAVQESPDYYSLIGPVTAQVGTGGRVCVYLRSQTKWAYKYGDAYWDDASLAVQSL